MKRLILIAFILVSLIGKAQTYDPVVEATDTLISGSVFIYDDQERKVAELTYHEFSADSISWHKVYEANDVWIRFSNDNQSTWFVMPVQAIIDLSGIRDSVLLNTNHRANDQDTVIGNEYQDLYSNGMPGNIGISDGNTLNINVNDGDTSSTNEINVLSLSNDTIYSSNGGGFVKVPATTPSYSLTSDYLPYWNGTTFVDSPFKKDGDGGLLTRLTTGWALTLNNNYSSSSGSYGLYINTLGSSDDNIGLNVDGSFLVYGSGRLRAYGYGSTSTFTGTVYRYLAVDADGNIIQATGTSGTGDDWGNQTALTSGFIDGSGIVGDPIILDVSGTPSNGYSITYNNGSLQWSNVSGGSGLWTSDTYGINYTSGNIGVGASSLNSSKIYAYGSSTYGITINNTSSSGTGLYVLQSGTSRPYAVFGGDFSFMTDNTLIWADASSHPSTPPTGVNKMYPINGVPYWLDDNGTYTSMIQGGAGYTLPTATDAILGGIKTSATTGVQMIGDYLAQSDIRLNTATPVTSDYIGFWDISDNAQRKMTISTLGTLIGGGGGSGTVTSVGMTVPTGFSITGSPITTSGTLGLGFASGYSLPTTANQNNWTQAYDNYITGIGITGTTTKTITLTQRDGGTITGNFTDLTGSGVTVVGAGNGMDFPTITSTGNVTLGTPSSISATSTNSVTTTSHTHAITGVPFLASTNAWTGYNTFSISRAGSAVYVNNPSGSGTAVVANGGFLGIDLTGGTFDLKLGGSGAIWIPTFATPPATSTSSGIAGTVLITADYIYVCTATDTWKRVALSTW